MYREKTYAASNGLIVVLVLIVAILGTLALMVNEFQAARHLTGIVATLALIVECFLLGGLFIVHPNEAKALVLFGTYKGTDRNTGLRWGGRCRRYSNKPALACPIHLVMRRGSKRALRRFVT